MLHLLYNQFPAFNRDFRCKVQARSEKKGTLVGVLGYVNAVGDIALASRIYQRARASRGDKFTRRLRRGLVITFYVK